MKIVTQRGFSLVEMLIAMLLGLFLIGGVIQVFLASKQTYVTQDALSRVQENGRLAVEFIDRDIRLGGYVGCSRMINYVQGVGRTIALNSDLNVDFSAVADKLLFNFQVPVEGLNNVGTVAGWSGSIAPVAGTDVLLLRGTAFGDSGFSAENVSGGHEITSGTLVSGAYVDSGGNSQTKTCTANNALCENDVAIISDCTKSRVFQISNLSSSGTDKALVAHAASGNPGNKTSNLSLEIFDSNVEISRASTVSYFVGVNPAGQNSLYRRVDDQAASELVEGVEDMQLLYGRDTNGDGVPNTYLTANQISSNNAVTNELNWSTVASVRVQLLLVSPTDGVLPNPQSVSFNGATVNSGIGADRRMRQVVSSTVGIRSRLP